MIRSVATISQVTSPPSTAVHFKRGLDLRNRVYASRLDYHLPRCRQTRHCRSPAVPPDPMPLGKSHLPSVALGFVDSVFDALVITQGALFQRQDISKENYRKIPYLTH